jgi:hypothetical protein
MDAPYDGYDPNTWDKAQLKLYDTHIVLRPDCTMPRCIKFRAWRKANPKPIVTPSPEDVAEPFPYGT